MEILPIAKIYTDFPEKFGLPRQSMILKNLKGKIVFEPEYRVDEAVRGLEGFSHIWLIWEFSKKFASCKTSGKESSSFTPTVRPPRLGGNKRMGVFATRSPNRPNPLALSCVKIEEIKKEPGYGTVIIVSGIDMADGTPVYDIKPYIASDSVPDAEYGFTYLTGDTDISVIIPDEIQKEFSEDYLTDLTGILQQDPRPHYQCADEKEYSFSFGENEITFSATGNVFNITGIKKRD